MKRRAWNIFKYGFLTFTLFVIVSSFGCSKTTAYSRAEFVMGTKVAISIFDLGTNKQVIKTAVDAAFEEVKQIDMLMSNYKGSSEVNKINRLGAGENIKVSDETVEVLRRSQEISVLTNGAFDITVLPLMELWGFYSEPEISGVRGYSDRGMDKKPADNQIRTALKHVGFEKIMLGNDNSVTKSEDSVKIVLGGIAKGYAIDRAVHRLKSYGIKSALIEAGGDLFCLGIKPDKNVWKIAVQHPRDRHKVIAILEVDGCAIATSGDYENYYMIEGERYSHIIDPRTGYPKGGFPASVTVVAKDAATADALATAVFVLGLEEGMSLVEKVPDVEAVIISDAEKKIKSKVSSGLKDKIRFIDD